VVGLTKVLQPKTMRPPIGKSYTLCARPAAWHASEQYRQGEIADVPLITRTIYRLCEEHCTLAARPPYREESPHAACM